MNEVDDMTLLRRYAGDNSEAAFEALVARHIRFVYSAAMRQARDPHLADEITQAVFIILAQKAGKIPEKTILSGWLFKTTRFAATAQIRAAIRRRKYEQEAQLPTNTEPATPDPVWQQLSPLLDEALDGLGSTDRQAILLRFFQNKSLLEVGKALGSGEDAARMRVARAVEKLRRFFAKRGVGVTAGALATAISAHSLKAAPPALAKSVTAVAIANGTVASPSMIALVKPTLKLMAWTKAKTAVALGAALLVAAGISVFVDTRKSPARTGVAQSGVVELDNYAGRFQMPGHALAIAKRGAGIAVTVDASQVPFIAYPESATLFVSHDQNSLTELVFTLDASGRATRLALTRDGKKLGDLARAGND
jgi:RNA polymerase sigma factor (sigma-70 family)